MRTYEELRNDVCKAIENRREEIFALGKQLWQTPETGFREYETSRICVEKFRSLGLEVKTGLAITGFRADLDTGRPGPTVALLGELDALIVPNHPENVKGNAHSCGHHAQMTGLYAAAVGLVDAHAADDMCGKIVFIGCPAEEAIETEFRLDLMRQGRLNAIGGKAQLIYEGVFDDVDMAYMNHLGKTYNPCNHNGMLSKRVIFTGKACHAASPSSGINALNAMDLARHGIAMWRESLCSRNNGHVRVHGIINTGGEVVNVIPARVGMEYMLRNETLDSLKQISDEFDRICLHSAQAMGCGCEIETVPGYMPLIDNDDLGEIYCKLVREIAGGTSAYHSRFASSCTDMGDIATIMPGLHGYVPGSEGASHGTDYRVSDPELAYLMGGKLPACMAVDLLYGDAASGKRIAEQKKNYLTPKAFVEMHRALGEAKKC